MRGFKAVVFLGFIALLAGSRTLPHPPNFTPIMAIALFSGAIFGTRFWAYAIPIGAMLLSDLFIGFHDLSGVVYLSLAPAVLIGSFFRQMAPLGERRSFFGLKWLGVGLSADLCFFILSNFGVWWLSGFYEHSVEGLIYCFTLALPFLLNQILGTATFLGLLLFTWYGLMVLAGWRQPQLSYQKRH